jgi:hypothetical protein
VLSNQGEPFWLRFEKTLITLIPDPDNAGVGMVRQFPHLPAVLPDLFNL